MASITDTITTWIRSRFAQSVADAVYTVEHDHIDGVARAVVYHLRIAAEHYAVDMPPGGYPDPATLHAFLVERITYEADTDPDYQRLRMPWRTVMDGTTDCKSSAIFIGALSLASGRTVDLRFTDATGNGWGHVYAIVDGVAVDPLLPFGDHPKAARSHAVRFHPLRPDIRPI